MTEANYVLDRFPMTISYNGNVNQFTVDGFAKINNYGRNTEDTMTVTNLNFLDFVIRFLSFLTKKDTFFDKKESNIAFDTKNNTFNKRTRLLGFSEKKKDVNGKSYNETVILNYNIKQISFNIEINENKKIKNIKDIYNEIIKLFTDDDLDKIDRNTITNNATNLYKQDTVFHLLRLRMWAENKFNESVSFFTKTECGNNNTLMNNHLPIMLLTDSYKLGHPNMYPNEAIKMVAYGEFRGPMKIDGETVGDDRIVVCGLEYIIKNYINRTWCKKDLDKAVEFFEHHAPGPDGMGSLYDFPKAEFEAIIDPNRKYNGKIPLTVEGLPDGTVVLPHTPVYKITAEKDNDINFSKLITFFETILTMVWYPSCVATLSRHCKQIIENAYMATGLANKEYKDGILQHNDKVTEDNDKEVTYISSLEGTGGIDGTIQFSMHDFGFRGATSVEQSVLGGMAHLLNFAGTDTMTAAYMAQQENGEKKPVGFSIPATEHSVMTSFPYEKDAIKNMFVKYIKPGNKTKKDFSIFAIVMDSYDYTRALFKELPNAIKDYNDDKKATFTQKGLILNNEKQKVKDYKNYKVVLRPDSGDSIEVVLLGLVAACAIFGWREYKVGNKTYIQCKNSGVIQGDGINVHKLEEILQTLTGTKKDENGQITYNETGVNKPLSQYLITSETDSQMESWFKEKPAATAAAGGGAGATAAASGASTPAAEALEAAAPVAASAPEVIEITHEDGKDLKTPKYKMTLEDYMTKIILTNEGDNGDEKPNVRITHDLIEQVEKVLKKLGEGKYFTPDCMAFGMGGGLIQKVNRDTMKFATKLCSSTQQQKEGKDTKTVIVMKNPATDSGKRSIPGDMDVITVEANKNNNIPFQVVSKENLEKQDKESDGGVDIKLKPDNDEKKPSLMTVKYTKDKVEGINEHFGKKRTRVNTGWNDLRTYIEGKPDEYYPTDRDVKYYDKTAKPHFSTKLNDMQQFYDPSQKKFVITKKSRTINEGNRNKTPAPVNPASTAAAADQVEEKSVENLQKVLVENLQKVLVEKLKEYVNGKDALKKLFNNEEINEQNIITQVDKLTSNSGEEDTKLNEIKDLKQQLIIKKYTPKFPPPATTSQAGGSSSQSPSSLINELNYELHLSMYVQKLLKMLIYRYLNHAGMELTYKEYMMEMFVNMVVFSVLNISNGEYFVCYLVDQMMIFIAMQIYLRIAQKENWTIDNNHLSAIILAPYYVVLC